MKRGALFLSHNVVVWHVYLLGPHLNFYPRLSTLLNLFGLKLEANFNRNCLQSGKCVEVKNYLRVEIKIQQSRD